jgi:hypothetical protein
MSGGSMPMLDRRTLLTGAAALLAHSGALAAPTSDWQPVAPAGAGFLPDLEAKLDQFITRRAANIHGVVIVRRGRLMLERYYEGDDQVRDEKGRTRVERIAFSAERSHELRSVTKSIVGLLCGPGRRNQFHRGPRNTAARSRTDRADAAGWRPGGGAPDRAGGVA